MTLTKADLQQALKQQEKTIISQISEFLEKHVLGPIFELKKDVSGLKKDVSGLKEDMKEVKWTVGQMDRRMEALFDRGDRHADQLENHEVGTITGFPSGLKVIFEVCRSKSNSAAVNHRLFF